MYIHFEDSLWEHYVLHYNVILFVMLVTSLIFH